MIIKRKNNAADDLIWILNIRQERSFLLTNINRLSTRTGTIKDILAACQLLPQWVITTLWCQHYRKRYHSHAELTVTSRPLMLSCPIDFLCGPKYWRLQLKIARDHKRQIDQTQHHMIIWNIDKSGLLSHQALWTNGQLTGPGWTAAHVMSWAAIRAKQSGKCSWVLVLKACEELPFLILFLLYYIIFFKI